MFQALRDALDVVKTCMGGDACDYKMYVSLGEPPADCNSITAWMKSSFRQRGDNNECNTSVYNTTFAFTITRCCISSDSSIEFDYLQEEKDAKCFLDDLEKLRECASCSLNDALSPYMIGCGALVESVILDMEKLGGCYSATINMEIVDEVCC